MNQLGKFAVETFAKGELLKGKPKWLILEEMKKKKFFQIEQIEYLEKKWKWNIEKREWEK